MVVPTATRPHPFSSFPGPGVRKHVRTFQPPPARPANAGSDQRDSLARTCMGTSERSGSAAHGLGPLRSTVLFRASRPVSRRPTRCSRGEDRARCSASPADGPACVPSPPSSNRRSLHPFSESPRHLQRRDRPGPPPRPHGHHKPPELPVAHSDATVTPRHDGMGSAESACDGRRVDGPSLHRSGQHGPDDTDPRTTRRDTQDTGSSASAERRRCPTPTGRRGSSGLLEQASRPHPSWRFSDDRPRRPPTISLTVHLEL